MNKCIVHVCFEHFRLEKVPYSVFLHSPESLSKDPIPVWSVLFCKYGCEGLSLLSADVFKCCWRIGLMPLPQFRHLYLRVLPSGQDLTWEQLCC